MAKKAVKTEFFPGSRREFRLNRYELLEVSVDGEQRKRGKLIVEMPISGKDFKSMPAWIGNPLGEMLKQDSVTGTIKIEAMCKGMTMDVYSTEKIRSRALSSTGVVISSLQLVPAGEGEEREIALHAVLYVPANVQFHEWVWQHIHGVFFADFKYSQTEMDFEGESGSAEDDDSEDVEDDDEDEDENEDTRLNRIAARSASKPRTQSPANA